MTLPPEAGIFSGETPGGKPVLDCLTWTQWPEPLPEEFHPDDPLNWFPGVVSSPRSLTTSEIARLDRLGFPDIADRLVAGRCEDCGLNRAGRTHRELCAERRPAPVYAFPWEGLGEAA